MRRLPMILTAAILVASIAAVAQADPYGRHRGAAPRPEVYVAADAFTPGAPLHVTVHVDRPAWVQVYETNARGQVRRLVRRSKGVRVVPGRPLILTRPTARGRGWHQIQAVASRRPLARSNTPFLTFTAYDECGYSDHDGFSYHYAGYTHGRYGRSANAAGVDYIRFRVVPYRAGTWSFHAGFDWIPAGGRVYVDGRYLGYGPSACRVLPVGRHRVTVQTAGGGKVTRWIHVGRDDVRYRAEVDRGRKDYRRR